MILLMHVAQNPSFVMPERTLSHIKSRRENFPVKIFVMACVYMWEIQIPLSFSHTLLALIGRVNICHCSQRSSVRSMCEGKAFKVTYCGRKLWVLAARLKTELIVSGDFLVTKLMISCSQDLGK